MATDNSTQDWAIFHFTAPEEPCKIPAGTILLGYRGSIAHNMYVPKTDPLSIDDVDLMGFVIGSRENYFGLSEWGSRGTKEYMEGHYDCVFYELRKAVGLLLQGNPNIVSMLWLRQEHYLYRSPLAALLIENRHVFVGKHVYNAFAGYAHAQLEKMTSRDPAELREYIAVTAELKARGAHPNQKGQTPGDCIEDIERPRDLEHGIARDVNAWGTEKLLARLHHYQKKGENIGYMGDKRKNLVLEHGYDAKNAAHLIRLLRMCKEFMQTGELIVYRSADAEELLSIKRGKWPLDDVKALSTQLFEECRAARDASALPPEPDRKGAEALLVEAIRESLK